MSVAIPAHEASRTGASDRPFFLEAHYYEAGLRVKPLGDQGTRPEWVPPTDYVGFRNEISLREGDTVVEVARFLFNGRRVTWVGVFVRSVDQVFGDRQNQAGVGVWLLDYDVATPEHLLDGLRKIAGPVAMAKIDTANAGARRFVDEVYLPTYLRPAAALPQTLSGWPFSPTAMPNTRSYLALSQEAEQAWTLAAEQVHRITLLPPRGDAAERALILVPGSSNSSSAPEEWSDLEPLKKGLASDLLAYLPDATSQVGEENRRLAAGTRSLEDRLQRSEAMLAESTRDRQELANRTSQLERQLSDDHFLSSLGAIDQRLQSVDARTRVIETAITTVRTELANSRFQPRQQALPPPSNPYQFQDRDSFGAARRENSRLTRIDAEARSYHFLLWPLVALIVALLGYVVWTKLLYPSSDPASAAETEAPGEAAAPVEQSAPNGIQADSVDPSPQGAPTLSGVDNGPGLGSAGAVSRLPGNGSVYGQGDISNMGSVPADQ